MHHVSDVAYFLGCRIFVYDGGMKRSANDGHIYAAHGAFHVRYYTTVLKDGQATRVQKSHKLIAKTGRMSASSGPVVDACKAFMSTVKDQVIAEATPAGITVAQFWERHYLPYCEREWKGKGMKPSSVRGFKQIWNQHLKDHFGDTSLRDYTARMARKFLFSLKTKQGKNTLRHLRAFASAMFGEAVERELIDSNPWRGLKLPKDCRDVEDTRHYTLEEAENIISALADHVDCQLVMALSCFLGLRPGEIAAVKWEDFDDTHVHIRRSVVRGVVGTPKTKESLGALPLIAPVRVPLELWRAKSGNPSVGYVFRSRNGTPVDLHNLIARVIVPHVEGDRKCVPCDRVIEKTDLVWKALYAGRRGACTFAVETTGGNYAVAQALLRHKSMTTTLNVYKKAITPQAFEAGMKLLEGAMMKSK